MSELIDTMVEKLDQESSHKKRPTRPLVLLGSHDSRFLKGINGKCSKMGLKVLWYEDSEQDLLENEDEYWDLPFIQDRETSHKNLILYMHDLDLCGIYTELPAVANAVAEVLRAMDMIEGKDITIIGRGEAVRGLAEDLIYKDATVTVCHSKTYKRSVEQLWSWSDVCIVASPKLDFGSNLAMSALSPDVIIDLSGAVPDAVKEWCTYIGPREIGRLTTAILVNRYMHQYQPLQAPVLKEGRDNHETR